MRKSLTKSEILRKTNDIRRVFNSGESFKFSGLRIKFLKNDFAFTRVLITFVRKYGKSVTRNREKRVIKEIFRLHKQTVKQGYDIIFIILPGQFTYQARTKQIMYLLSQSNLLRID